MNDHVTYTLDASLVQAMAHAIGTMSCMQLTPAGVTAMDLLAELRNVTSEQDRARAAAAEAQLRTRLEAEIRAAQQTGDQP